MLNNIDKEIKCLTQKREIKASQNAKFSQNREICEPQKREIKVSQNAKFSQNREISAHFLQDGKYIFFVFVHFVVSVEGFLEFTVSR